MERNDGKSAIYVRIDSELKKQAEEIMAGLNMTPTVAIRTMYAQIVLRRGMPFEIAYPDNVPVNGAATPQNSRPDNSQAALNPPVDVHESNTVQPLVKPDISLSEQGNIQNTNGNTPEEAVASTAIENREKSDDTLKTKSKRSGTPTKTVTSKGKGKSRKKEQNNAIPGQMELDGLPQPDCSS